MAKKTKTEKTVAATEVEKKAPKKLVKPRVKRGDDTYRVLRRSNDEVVESGFANREGARKLRNYHTEKSGSNYVICRGEDHPKGSTDGHDHQPKKNEWLY